LEARVSSPLLSFSLLKYRTDNIVLCNDESPPKTRRQYNVFDGELKEEDDIELIKCLSKVVAVAGVVQSDRAVCRLAVDDNATLKEDAAIV
jgi:hypothetical protein